MMKRSDLITGAIFQWLVLYFLRISRSRYYAGYHDAFKICLLIESRSQNKICRKTRRRKN